jgi:Holliday junction resolvasome RuvABC endonuclease subunit
MATLSIDGGAERLGWALLEKGIKKPVYLQSGLVEFPRGDTPFQEYRIHLVEAYVQALTQSGSILNDAFISVSEIVNETLPPVGFNNGVQAYLVNVALTTVQTLGALLEIPIYQIGARTVQSRIAITGSKKTKKVSKVQVRNGVLALLPELEPRKSDWTGTNAKYDECDAIAIGLAHLGFRN